MTQITVLMPLILSIVNFTIILAHFNLFMNETETERLLGISGEVFYVRSGIVNDYALSFNLPIQSDTSDIYFNWQNLRRSPPDPAMFYSLGLSVSNTQAMSLPTASIRNNGEVPTTKSVFKVTLPCSGMITADVDIKIFINVTIFSASNVTTLELRRRKTCHKGKTDAEPLSRDFHDKPLPLETWIDGAESDTFIAGDGALLTGSSSHVFYIGIGCACGGIMVIALSVFVYYMRTKKATDDHRLGDVMSSLSREPVYMTNDHTTSRSTISGAASLSRRGMTSSAFVELRQEEVRRNLKAIAVSYECLSLSELLMEGTFGRIYIGTMETTNDSKTQVQQVFIKTVTDEARADQVDVMLREGCFTLGLQHDNINSITAACLDPDHHPLLIYPFLDEGNLKKFLQRCKISDVAFQQVLNTQQLVYIAIQITKAVNYLHKRCIVHSDLATRNCVVDSRLTVRLTDKALSRDVFPNEYHCLGDNENRPVKWLALEALNFRIFSPASDTWAFGVLLWELMTLGQIPYANIDPFEMSTYLKAGYRVTQPVNCPNELFAIMACCWSFCPEERPTFKQLQRCLQDFYTALGQFV